MTFVLFVSVACLGLAFGCFILAPFFGAPTDQELKDKEIELHMRAFERQNRRQSDQKFEVLKP